MKHQIPHGGLFELISCPNYWGEIIVYFALALLFLFRNYTWNFIAIWVTANQVLCFTIYSLSYIEYAKNILFASSLLANCGHYEPPMVHCNVSRLPKRQKGCNTIYMVKVYVHSWHFIFPNLLLNKFHTVTRRNVRLKLHISPILVQIVIHIILILCIFWKNKSIFVSIKHNLNKKCRCLVKLNNNYFFINIDGIILWHYKAIRISVCFWFENW